MTPALAQASPPLFILGQAVSSQRSAVSQDKAFLVLLKADR
jgi:hypothetical protein